jgi:hypothetical protein
MADVRSFLRMVNSLSSVTPPVLSRDATTSKGLFFIHLYGVYEYTVKATVQETIQVINAQGLTVADCKPVLLGMVLDAQCHSLADVGRATMWQKRRELFQHVNSPSAALINTAVFPTSGRHLRDDQLRSIWLSFDVQGPVLPNPRLRVRINELIENRNAIAHGSSTPAQVGSRYTNADLTNILNDSTLR